MAKNWTTLSSLGEVITGFFQLSVCHSTEVKKRNKITDLAKQQSTKLKRKTTINNFCRNTFEARSAKPHIR